MHTPGTPGYDILPEQEFWDAHALRSKTYLTVPTIETLSAPFMKSCDACFMDELKEIDSKTVLDVGCGLGELSLVLSKMGASVIGLDISRIMVNRSQERSHHTHIPAMFVLGNAQHLPFVEGSMDLVVGMRAIHHFPDLNRFFQEVYRVLKPGGRAVFVEPQKKNPLVEFNRKVLNPEMRTKGEHPLVDEDIESAGEVFDNISVRGFYLVSPASYVFKFLLSRAPLYQASYRILQKLDSILERRDSIRSYCWQVVLVLDKE